MKETEEKRYEEIRLVEVINGLSEKDRTHVAVALECKGRSIEEICEEIRWLYHSKARRAVVATAKQVGGKVVELGRETLGKFPATWNDRVDQFTGWFAGNRDGSVSTKTSKSVSACSTKSTKSSNGSTIEKNDNQNADSDFPTPTWNQLIKGLASHLGVYDKEAKLATNEKYICQDIIVRALKKMKPKQREQFFSQDVDLSEIVESGAPTGSNAKPALRGFGALGLAQAAGFSLYTSSATALSFLSGSVGVTLPFAAYTGLSTFLSVITGPVGWIAMGGLLGWKVTLPEWRKMTPVIIFIINLRAEQLPFPSKDTGVFEMG